MMPKYQGFSRFQGARVLESELIRKLGEGLDSEQAERYHDDGNFAEAHAMLDDMEARLGINVQIARLGLGSKIAALLDRYPNLTVAHTGGGCRAYQHPIDGALTEGQLLITDGEQVDALPTDASFLVSVGVYPDRETGDGETTEIKLDDVPAWIEANWVSK